MSAATRTIACVLHTDPFYNRSDRVEYTPEHVRWLKRQVERFCTLPHRFVCLSNVEIPGVETIPLEHNWPGWWSKLELFKHLDEAFYLDLDTVLVGCIDALVTCPREQFLALQSLTPALYPRLNSGVMAWFGDYRFLYEAFKADPAKHMAAYNTPRRWGDQGFIQEHLAAFDTFQRHAPGQVISYKADMKQDGNPPPACNVVCFHGQPKPHDVMSRHSWIMR